MFSFFIIGKNLERQSDSYTILASSALIILTINPLILFHVGFQFSYLAVLGIIYFQPKLSGLIQSDNKAVRYVWDLFTVSFAAQLTTFPLGLYYFHQFPVYFWLTNLIVIPVVSLIMGGAVIFAVFLLFPGILTYISIPLNLLLKFLNFLIASVSELPFANIPDIRFTGFHLVLTSFLILFLMIFIADKKYRRIPAVILICSIVFILQDIFFTVRRQDEKEIIIYSSGKEKMFLSLIDGKRHLLLTKGCDTLERDIDVKFLKPFWIAEKIEHGMQWIALEKEFPGYQYQSENLKLLIVPGGFLINFSGFGMTLLPDDQTLTIQSHLVSRDNVFIIDKNSGYPDDNLSFQGGLLILDCSLSEYRKTIWKKYATEHQLAIFDLKLQGAFRKIIE